MLIFGTYDSYITVTTRSLGGSDDGFRPPDRSSLGLLLLLTVDFIPDKAAVADQYTIGGQHDNNIFD